LNDVTLTSPNIGADQWGDAQHTHASAATAGSTLGPGTTLGTPTLQTPAVSGTMTFGGDATLARTGAGALRVDTHLGVGSNPAAWVAGVGAVEAGGAGGGAWYGYPGFTALGVNTFYDGAFKARAAGPASLAILDGGLRLDTAPSVAAGAAQTFTTRMALAQTGTLTLTPNAGVAGLVANVAGGGQLMVADGILAGGDARLYSTHHLEVQPAGGAVLPAASNSYSLGLAGTPWSTVYAQNGTIQPSSASVKEDITPLDPALALEAVRATPAVTFTYTAPEKPPEYYDLPDDPEQAQQVLEQRLTAAPLEAAARQQAGFIAEEAHSLFLVGEGQTSPGNSIGILLAALQELDRRLTAIETP
jgi:endosialidase-like protein